MKLPDFKDDRMFVALRNAMGAPYVEWSPPPMRVRTVDISELLRSQKGIEIGEDITELEFNEDGTFSYQGHRVLVYIRDQYYAPGREYKFHLGSCSKIVEMYNSGRKNRYVVTTNTSGEFFVRLMSRDEIITREGYEPMRVCKLCLEHLNYRQYRFQGRREKRMIYEAFSIDEFFRAYGETRFEEMPDYTEYDAPLNEYPPDWASISDEYRQSLGWRCEQCHIDLSQNRHWLHVHHRNHQRSDSRRENLIALCIGCHAEQVDHILVRYNPDYRGFREAYPTWSPPRFGNAHT